MKNSSNTSKGKITADPLWDDLPKGEIEKAEKFFDNPKGKNDPKTATPTNRN